MTVRLILDTMFSFSVIVPLVMSDLAWPLNHELSAPETDFSLNNEVLAFDQSMNFNSSPEPDLFPENAKSSDFFSNDEIGVNESFELADCSSSELRPALGTSRMRRRGVSEECKNPTSTSSTSAFSLWDPAIDPWGLVENRIEQNSLRYSDCVVLTFNVLPFGLCHSGVGAVPSEHEVNIGGLSLQTFDLQHCSPSMSNSKPILLRSIIVC